LLRRVLAEQKGEMATVPLFPGMRGVLEALSRAGTRLAILSSNAEGTIRACLRGNGVEGLFEAVAGYRRLFGKGRAIRRFLKANQLAGAEAAYVGDEVRDVEAARQAGVAVAAVAWGFNDRELLAGQAPDCLADSPEQLLGWLR
jgi:phosphoglycolate phosphatase